MSEAKLYRKMGMLMGNYNYMPKSVLENRYMNGYKDPYVDNARKIYEICDKLKITDECTIKRVWQITFGNRFKEKENYNKNKVIGNPLKDNRTFHNGDKPMLGGTPRVPRKKRKTAWKRFAKLFPNHKYDKRSGTVHFSPKN